MQRPSDDHLVAYLDGELETTQRQKVEAWLDNDPAARHRLASLTQSAHSVRLAFDEVLREPIPDRLIAAVRGQTDSPPARAQILPIRPQFAAPSAARRWWLGVPVAASLFGLLVGGATVYVGFGKVASENTTGKQQSLEVAAANNAWLDNAAGYFKLFASASDNPPVDIPATGDPREALQKISQNLPHEVRLPDLKPWGLNFRGARLVVEEGRPAAELVYTTENKAIGPLILIIGSSKQSDLPPTLDRRQDVNLLYWRHQGRAYALVSQADIGYLWGIANDVAWQLDAI
ncbi:MAG: anti-sigma factor [Alphaproteobacteria bacterium]|nr:anti-sigma factor [Alphaproteobacteria bacterium]